MDEFKHRDPSGGIRVEGSELGSSCYVNFIITICYSYSIIFCQILENLLNVV